METTLTSQELYGGNAVVGGGASIDETQVTTTSQENKTSIEIKPEQQQTPSQPQAQPELPIEQQVTQEVQKQLTAEKDIQTQLDAHNINFDDLAAEYGEHGKLSDKTIESLEKAGFPKTAVDAYITGMEAIASRFENTVVSFAGSREDFEKVQSFVKSLGSQYVDAFNKSIQTGDLTQIKMNIEGFKAQMLQTYGTSNPTLTGAGGISTIASFSSAQEMVKAINDPKYGKDNAYTHEVQTKIKNSSFIR